jgi:hypothetical protein
MYLLVDTVTIRYFDNLDVFFTTTLKGVYLVVDLLIQSEVGLLEVVGDEILRDPPVLFRCGLEYLKIRLLQVFIEGTEQSGLEIIVIHKLANN